MAILETIGWIGAVLLATCGLPQMFKTLKTRDFRGLSLTFVIWWFLGEIFTLIDVIYTAFRWPLLFNYTINIIVCSSILMAYLLYKNLSIKQQNP